MIKQLINLHTKYLGNLPRYTSYPTAVELKEIDNIKTTTINYREAIQSSNTISLYIHLPFCPSLCYFCACNKIITQDQSEIDAYLEFLEIEAKLVIEQFPKNAKVVQIHLGGGSPSYLSLKQFEKLNDILDLFPCSSSCSKSIEVDPRSITIEKLRLLYQQGYRRYSLGVQDFDENVQKLVNRIQPFSMTAEVINEIRRNSDSNINSDLIYGLPGQTQKSFHETIDKLIQLKPERIALYGYAHVTWKVKVQNTLNKYGLPDAAARIQFFTSAVERLQAAGYIYIGLDHFALPSDELALALNKQTLRRNFMGYTTVDGESLIALGVSGISDLNKFLFQNSISITDYKSILTEDKLPIIKQIKRSEDDLIRSYIIETLMCQRELSLNRLKDNFPNSSNAIEIFKSGLEDLEKFIADGLLEVQADKIRITILGSFFLRQIVSVFDSYLDTLNKTGTKFSAAI